MSSVPQTTTRDVVVLGASAGGVTALRSVVAGLPERLPAAVLAVLHVPRSAPSALPRILDRSGSLPAAHAVDGEPLVPGRIYVAPPDHHLLVTRGRVQLARGPSENGHRPAVDPLFRSAALAYGPKVIGGVLSGARDDGAAGLTVVDDRGGVTLVQDPTNAMQPGMPLAAMQYLSPDHVVPAAKIGPLIGELVGTEAGEAAAASDAMLTSEVTMAGGGRITMDDVPGSPAGFGCPACGGALWDLRGTRVPRYRCRVGHAWSPESLLAEQDDALEKALWTALRALEDKAASARRLAASSRTWGLARLAERQRHIAASTEHADGVIRGLLEHLSEAEDVEARHQPHQRGTGEG